MEPTLDLRPTGPDPLGVLGDTARVLGQAVHLRLDGEAALRFATAHRPGQGPSLDSPPEDALHCRFLPPKRRLNYLLALEALNFSFWDDAPRWRVDGGGAHGALGMLDGYWALIAALRRAMVTEALPVWDAHWLAGLDLPAVEALLAGEGRAIPMLDTRLAHLREAGTVLLRDWGGQFANVVKAAEGDAAGLAYLIASTFPSFDDRSPWGEHTVRFFKRAQICVADLAHIGADMPQGRLDGLAHLTAFADYKVPQVLRKVGVIVLGDDLARRVDALEELPAHSVEEVELRAATIWGVEWLRRALEAAHPGQAFTAAGVDALLWLAGQDKTGLPPYHRTRTPYY